MLRVLGLCSILAAPVLVLPGQEQQTPVVISPKDLSTLLAPQGADRDRLLKQHHGKQIQVTGKATVWRGQVEIVPITKEENPKVHALRVQFADPADAEKIRKAIDQNTPRRLDTVLTLTGDADFARTHQRPADDYVVPPELRPRTQIRIVTGQQLWEMFQTASTDIDPRILEDARKKGKLVTEEHYYPYWLKAARIEVAKKPPVPKPDPEKTAAARLELAKRLLENPKTKASATERLKEIVRDHPDTAAAKEAKALLGAK